MIKIDKVLYTGKTHTTGGRDGSAQSDDRALDIKLSPPGSGKGGTNPEQLFAAGWSACFIGALGIAAGKRKMALPALAAVDAEVDLGQTDGSYFLQARLNVSLPGIERELARVLVEEAHQTCPYSKATRGNINVELNVV
ncbi:organic hydroperoxide resistance protein [Rhizobium cauense]|uniref:organic hydroperoxide resistance protein n=1 Tax=Rhizobium cauense TaxID=1166683 RepID=UPI0005674270|nr:organic hydroperoxide resistance protein [Rhizobium cauense]MBW9118252.1 organic hydroperoxide resistance protein [Rhizobium cauense]